MEAHIPAPADREVWFLIKFLNAQTIAPIEIHSQLCRVYGPNVMSMQMVRRWCRQFTAGRQHVHVERSGRPYKITDDLVELVRESRLENRHFTITPVDPGCLGVIILASESEVHGVDPGWGRWIF